MQHTVQQSQQYANFQKSDRTNHLVQLTGNWKGFAKAQKVSTFGRYEENTV